MQRNCLVALVFSIMVLIVGFACESKVSAAEETEILKITVGEPTKLSDLVSQNTASLMVSRTGVMAVFYPKPRTGPKFYRVSTDGGQTWGPEMNGPPELGGGQDSGTLRDGGVIMPVDDPSPSAKGKKGWYDTRFVRFTDDMMRWQIETVETFLPNAGPPSLDVKYPGWSKGKMVQLPNGDMLAPMYGGFKGDSQSIHRAIIVRSKDQGHTWTFYASIAYEPVDPHPELPGHYLSAAEPSITLLPNGQMLAMLRTQYSHLPGEYKPMAVCWSKNLGKTWTKPVLTKPHLMNILPTLAALDNGVVACQYGRPGFHVAFSLDDGHTWQDRVSFSGLPCGVITGQFDMIKVGPNQLAAVGSDAEGTKVWPISVERVKVSPAHVSLEGRVLDQQGNPIAGAKVERSPNRYALDDWLEHATRTDPTYHNPWTVGSPVLGYRSIQKQYGHPTVQTDTEGRFRFESVKLGEYVLTVEANGHAPQHRHIKLGPQAEPQDFRMKAGRRVRSRVVDNTARPVPGACVVLNLWHIHTDTDGYFHWSVGAPLPEQVQIRIYKRYSGQYETLKTAVPFSQIERHPIILRRKS